MSSRRGTGPNPPARLRRAGGFAATSAVLASTAHAAAGGGVPSVWLLALGAAVVAGAAVPLLGREATWPRIALALAAAQAALHGWLALVSGSHAGHDGHPPGITAQMLLAHAVATAAAVVWLRYAEQRLWQAARRTWVLLRLWRRRWMSVPAIHERPRARPPRSEPCRNSSPRPACAHGVRGPPVLVGR